MAHDIKALAVGHSTPDSSFRKPTSRLTHVHLRILNYFIFRLHFFEYFDLFVQRYNEVMAFGQRIYPNYKWHTLAFFRSAIFQLAIFFQLSYSCMHLSLIFATILCILHYL
ncbi:hypothetical protein L228DRAFT_2182 [Xylona heveae TC161]|uniref:Uncharacterized protein n=1 Tax=Xylona heveae (strain CBS 132557 / TC161) TaxID=1328760 RepID=A0A165JAF4_XYLHT|nr:hypothetical protein L228DRAFT_2182 [Xylona heveae TC161]KZF25969.1 hypothetical protein L228DRAFT_2182 [Xylona heveae TC161]